MNTIDEPASCVESPAEAPLQAALQDIWEQKYQLRGRLGKPVERDIDHCYQRIADTIDDSMANILRELYEADITLMNLHTVGLSQKTVTVMLDDDRVVAPYQLPQDLTPGTYLLSVECNGERKLHKIMVKR